MEAVKTDEEVGESLGQFCEKDKTYWLLRQDFFGRRIIYLFVIQQILMEQLAFGRYFVKCCECNGDQTPPSWNPVRKTNMEQVIINAVGLGGKVQCAIG